MGGSGWASDFAERGANIWRAWSTCDSEEVVIHLIQSVTLEGSPWRGGEGRRGRTLNFAEE